MNAYEICKYFKSIYVQLNFAPIIHFNSRQMIFETGIPYYINSGELLEKNEFTEWLNGKLISVNTADIIELGKVLKKNAIEANCNENTFSIKFLTKEGNEKTITFLNNSDNKELFEKFENYKKLLTKKQTLPIEYFKDDILELFIDNNGNIVLERQPKKLIEIPTNKIEQVKGGDYYIEYSEEFNGQRYVQITSKNSDLKLSQFFITI